MKFEVIEWNPLYDELIKNTSDIIDLANRIDSDESSKLTIETVFNLLFIVDMYYKKNLIKNLFSTPNFGVPNHIKMENYYNLPEELFNLKEDDFLKKIINESDLLKTFPSNVSLLFTNLRKELLNILEFSFKANEPKISKFSYSILCSCNILTKKLRNGYLYGTTLDNFLSKIENINMNGMEIIKILPSFPLDLVKTFINAIKQTKISQILDVSKDDTKYGLLSWLNGFDTIIIDTNIKKLSHYEVLTYQYNALLNDHLIFPPNDENKIKSIVCIKDSLPELKRLKITKNNIFGGIIANFSFTELSIDEFFHSIDRLISLLAPNGYVLLQDYFKPDDTPNSEINTIPVKKKEFEEYLEKKSIRILLRTNDFHLITKTSYILKK